MQDKLQRRPFLAGILKAAVASSVTGVSSGCRPTATQDAPRNATDDDPDRPIIVVGAGMSGLCAARALHDSGRSVVVIEARDRLGGRTWTDSVGRAQVDLGGAWMHGIGETPLRAVADAAGLQYSPQLLEPDDYYDGQRGERPHFVAGLQILGIVEEYDPEELDASADPRASVADGIQEFLRSREQELDPTMAAWVQFALEELHSDEAGRMDRQSLVGGYDAEWPWNQTFGDVDDEDYVIDGGYRMLVDFLADGLNIRLNSPVTHIEHNEDGVVVRTQEESLAGSHVIVTIPLGVLKANAIEFVPPLPVDKRRAIERTGFGVYEKVILSYDENFWSSSIGVTSYFAGTGVDRAWPLFIDMSEFAGAPTLVCLYSGHFGQKTQDTLDDAAIVAGATAAVAELCGESIPEPVASFVTRWRSDPFARGSYSYASIDTLEGDRDLLAAPVGERLLFAGEATSAAVYATVDGALTSGLREARRLVPDATIPGVPVDSLN